MTFAGRILSSALALICFATTASGCGPHRIPLPPPPESTSVSLRLKSFQQMRPRTEYAEVWLNEQKMVVRKFEDSMVLNNGLLVEHPLDLVPWVPRDSQVAHQAARFEARDRTARALELPVLVALGLGLPATFLGFQQFLSGPRESEGLVAGLIGVGALATGVVFYLLSAGPRADANHAKRSAFLGFEQGLKGRLDLCDGPDGPVVACEVVRAPKVSPARTSTSAAESSTHEDGALEPVDASEL